jgi:hypothetical protein
LLRRTGLPARNRRINRNTVIDRGKPLGNSGHRTNSFGPQTPLKKPYAACLANLGYAYLPNGDRGGTSCGGSHNTGLLPDRHYFGHAGSQSWRYVHLYRPHRCHSEGLGYGLDWRKPGRANRRFDRAWGCNRLRRPHGYHRRVTAKSGSPGNLSLNNEISRRRIDRDVGSLRLTERLQKKLVRRSRAGLPERVENPGGCNRHEKLRHI